MKCISLQQPWASLLVSGAKKIETRSWQTTHRGPLAVHASKSFLPLARSLCWHEPFKTALEAAGYASWDELPLGRIIGVMEVIDCKPVEELDLDPSSDEAAFGDYRPGRWGWLLANASPLIVPIPFKGQLGLFDVPDLLSPVEDCRRA
jgi:activating signal cointegrator 1